MSTRFLQYFALLYCYFCGCSEATTFFPKNTAYGLFAAIAVPLDLPHYNVFMSYNFEANYDLPKKPGIPPIAILAAIAVPLDLPHRNVYFSYNFEANYNLPYEWGIPPFAQGIEDEDFFEHEMRQLKECGNCSTTTTTATIIETHHRKINTTEKSKTRKIKTKSKPQKESREKRSLLTRSNFYQILKHKFEISGYKGESCLLRLICETNASRLGDMNGVLGSLVHILFAPSSSMYEELPLIYYQAELDGVNEQCEHYAPHCTENILDFISTPLHEIIDQLSK